MPLSVRLSSRAARSRPSRVSCSSRTLSGGDLAIRLRPASKGIDVDASCNHNQHTLQEQGGPTGSYPRRTVAYAASGSVADLERQGLVRRTRRPRPGNLTATVAYRCAAFERVRPLGLNLAWGFDELASASNKGLRVHLARQRRAVAAAM